MYIIVNSQKKFTCEEFDAKNYDCLSPSRSLSDGHRKKHKYCEETCRDRDLSRENNSEIDTIPLLSSFYSIPHVCPALFPSLRLHLLLTVSFSFFYVFSCFPISFFAFLTQFFCSSSPSYFCY